MPANLPVEYFKLEREYWKERNKKNKIKILKKMISVIPKHKGSEKVIGELRRRISKLKEEIKSEEKKKKLSRRKIGIKKEGAGQVVLVGYPNSGKSYLMNKLCNKNIPSTPIPFETENPEVGMMEYRRIKIQLIEIPSFYDGFEKKRKMLMGLIKNADLVAIMEDEKIQKKINAKNYVVINSREDLNEIKEKIWKKLGKIIVYTKEPGKKNAEPIAMNKGSTIKDLGERIHKDFVERFKYAKVKNERIKRVGLNYELRDGDVVEFHLR